MAYGLSVTRTGRPDLAARPRGFRRQPATAHRGMRP
jgi:hypothetical protein